MEKKRVEVDSDSDDSSLFVEEEGFVHAYISMRKFCDLVKTLGTLAAYTEGVEGVEEPHTSVYVEKTSRDAIKLLFNVGSRHLTDYEAYITTKMQVAVVRAWSDKSNYAYDVDEYLALMGNTHVIPLKEAIESPYAFSELLSFQDACSEQVLKELDAVSQYLTPKAVKRIIQDAIGTDRYCKWAFTYMF